MARTSPAPAVEATAAIQLRDEVLPTDVEAVRRIVTSTGFFADHEIDVAVELVQERLARGPASGYYFVFADRDGRPIGYTCYGPIACTLHSHDLYWIAVQSDQRGSGVGKLLMAATEQRIAAAGGRQVYIETSSQDHYTPTRAFYERCQYQVAAILADFYAPGDNKFIFVKALG